MPGTPVARFYDEQADDYHLICKEFRRGVRLLLEVSADVAPRLRANSVICSRSCASPCVA
ncbi:MULTISPECIES: hypothetical protein [Streptomyces]|uniref:Uncharacterized protein n=1 Tax=Streptomyces canarius TaxID=285453 RepID=A0ABQ3CWS8_9ACTN|nr:hypothetical protein [Streptomyces canarius]GHA47726.1 hypothetical protein GCM10010345_60230 [Streptomyces canarius]